ncbi:DNA methylase [Thiomicrospira aerophila AL3]|uniref:DNA methylase n=1 Tax=Thiomicrospira aerophila AL3 TaxID=717772 RepID=W0DU58_9GAMM|nr:site-specific DNA-methyltransferase [Thiomicrospira aerophila]AHF01982.1 DNA methylase [Thiomicrospira aerophila AL3]
MPILQWLNKDESLLDAKNCRYRLLQEKSEFSYGEVDSNNMLIQGDNLEALKALIPYYAGQVKCIFIDPPYNTKGAFEHYDDNLEHSKWLSLMYPRLELLAELLSENGSIWISIDDDESHYLKVVMDEIFGRHNFVANIVWQKKYAPQNDAKWFSDNHDHILVYAKNKEAWRPNLLPRSDEANSRYKNPDNDPRGPWKAADMSVKTYSESNDYPITVPSGRVVKPSASRCWGYSKERYEEMVKDNRIWFGQSGNNVPAVKKFLTEVKDGTTPMTIWPYQEVGHNQEAKKESRLFNPDDAFATPKPEKLIQRILTLASEENDLVLDSFLGSGTTAAVAHKMKRRYIGVEIGDHAKTHCQNRLKQVVNGEQGGISKSLNWSGGGGFKFYELGEMVFNEYGSINPEIKFPILAAHIWYLETKKPIHITEPSPFLGCHGGTAYYLLYNGVLGDRRPSGGNVLTRKVLNELPNVSKHEKIVIYGESCRLGGDSLKQANIIFKQIPYDVGLF